MATNTQIFMFPIDDPDPTINWAEYYPKLLFTAKCLVYKYRLPCWYGQEEDIAEDVAQETVWRTIERIKKAALGEASPIGSLEHMMVVIAKNYILDMRRREYRLVRLLSSNPTYERRIDVNDLESMSEIAIEHIYHEWLFRLIAHEIVQMPYKQRYALLIDLANRTSFETNPTSLQAALIAVGIGLQEYQQPLPISRVERLRHASLVSLAYKRLAQIIKNQLLLLKG